MMESKCNFTRIETDNVVDSIDWMQFNEDKTVYSSIFASCSTETDGKLRIFEFSPRVKVKEPSFSLNVLEIYDSSMRFSSAKFLGCFGSFATLMVTTPNGYISLLKMDITYENDSNLSASLKQIFELETQTHSSRFSESIEPTSHPKIIKKQLGKWRGLSSMTEEVKRQTFKSSKAESGCAAFITSISVNCLNHNVLLTNYNGNVFYLEPDKLDKTQADSKSTLLPPLLSLPCHPSAIEWISPATFVVNGGSNELLLFDIRTPLQKADKCTPQPAGILRFPLNYTSQSTTSGAEASFPSSPYYPPSTSTLSSPSFPYALLSSPPNVSCIAHHPHNPHIIGVGTTHGQISLLDVRTASSPLLHPTSLSTGSSCVASFVPSHSSSSVLSLMLHPVLQNTAVASTTDGNIAVLNYESSTVSPSSATPITSLASFPGVCSSLSSSISPSHPEASIAMDVEPSSSSSSMQVKKSISLSRPIRAFAMHPFLDIGVAGDETGAFTFVGPVAR